MSLRTLCDCCGNVIYNDKGKTTIKITISNRYGPTKGEESLDLCENCDIKIATALLKLLPKVAYNIEPNAGKI